MIGESALRLLLHLNKPTSKQPIPLDTSAIPGVVVTDQYLRRRRNQTRSPDNPSRGLFKARSQTKPCFGYRPKRHHSIASNSVASQKTPVHRSPHQTAESTPPISKATAGQRARPTEGACTGTKLTSRLISRNGTSEFGTTTCTLDLDSTILMMHLPSNPTNQHG